MSARDEIYKYFSSRPSDVYSTNYILGVIDMFQDETAHWQEIGQNTYMCTKCGTTHKIYGLVPITLYHYCNECGAKME